MSMSVDWIIGFLEGEGCFTASGGGIKHYYKLYPKVEIVQKQKDVLEKIRMFLGYGNVYTKNFRLFYKNHPDQHAHVPEKGDGTSYTYIIQNKPDLLKFIALIDGKLVSDHKREQYEVWKEKFMPHLLRRPRMYSEWSEESKKSQREKLRVIMLERHRDLQGRFYKQRCVRCGKPKRNPTDLCVECQKETASIPSTRVESF